MNKTPKYLSGWFFVLLFVSITCIILFFAYGNYSWQKKTIRSEKQNELLAIYKVKEKQISDWKHERFTDARLIKNNPDFINHISAYLNSSNKNRLGEYISPFINSILSTNHYKSVLLLNKAGIPVFPLSDTTEWQFSQKIHEEEIDYSAKQNEIILTSLHLAPDSQSIFHIIIPISDEHHTKNIPEGFLVLSIDPNKEFYPLLQTFQMYSKTAEALLVRKENNNVLFINELRHVSNAALKMKFPVENSMLAASMAARGQEGVVDAIDYRNHKILAAIGKIKDTNWYLVVKIDDNEIYSDLRKLARNTAIVVFLILISTFAILRLFWLKKVLQYDKDMLKLEFNYKLLNQKYNLVVKYANDAVILWDEDNILIEVNDRALDLYKYTAEEIKGLPVEILMPPEVFDEFRHITGSLKQSNGIRYETWHKRKNDDVFPVEISSRFFNIDNKQFYQSIVRDITKRKEVENNLRESEEKFRHLFENISNCVAVYEAIDDGDDFIIKDFNKSAEFIEKVNKNNILGRRVKEIFPGIKEYGLLEVFHRVWQTGITERFPVKLYKDKRISGWRENYVYKLPSGEIVAVYEDKTQEMISNEVLKENEQRLRLALMAANQGLYDLNVQSGEAIVSPEYEIMLGYKPGELKETNSKWHDRLLPDDKENVFQTYKDFIAGKISEYKVEFRQKTKDGNWVWISSIGKLVEWDNEGRPLRMIGTHTDITAKKIAEEKLRYNEQLLNEMGKIAKIGGWEFDTQSLKGSWTDEAARIHELDPNDETSVELGISFYHEESRIKIKKAMKEAVENGRSYDLELELTTKNGNRKWVRTIGKPVIENGKIIKVRGAFQDITERRLAREQIIKLNAELEKRVEERTLQLAAKNRELETFTYSVSHDLKAPLRGIEGYSRILTEEYEKLLDEEGKRLLFNIRENALQMNQLINDLLEYSRLEKHTLQPVNIKIRNQLDSIISQLFNFYSDRKLEILNNVPDVEITADHEGLILSVRNILENAIKFTKTISKPLIEIGYEKNPSFHIIYIRDNGIGFDMKYHRRIYEIFQRLHRVEDYPGTGIGLAMVSKAMQRMGGKVWAESEKGKGSVFYLEIPKTKHNYEIQKTNSVSGR